jgi:putative pyruvate formate lyase activating enzyme
MFELHKDFESFSLPVRQMLQGLSKCTLCPRKCRVNRLSGETGYCQIGGNALLSSAGPHFGEEPVLVGHGGSGTIFFSGCNLSCIFCQNYQISQEANGREVTVEELAETMLILEERGCCSVNFVSPTHVVASVAAAIELARQQGLKVPTVYNSGGYESVSTIRKLEGLHLL